MSAIDILFLLVGVVALTAMLLFSKVIRAIAWESLRHPFTHSRIEVDGNKVEIHRPVPSKDDQPAGAR
jgi:hypothetical protein